MNILVTGHKGFIGTNLFPILKSRFSDNIFGLDIKDGKLLLSDRPGLGVDLIEEDMEKHPGIRSEKVGFYVWFFNFKLIFGNSWDDFGWI